MNKFMLTLSQKESIENLILQANVKQLAVADGGLKPVFDWAWNGFIQYIILGIIIVVIVKALHNQKMFTVILAVIGASFGWYFVTNFQTVFNFINQGWSKLFGG
ncbi:TcpD family membrane protein [Lactococcus protaetiae]|uniref:Uncharacterized protein n=1 Tax=Lactococcus protaetiae TaxID=2592653 RepID=A0A514Z841_9LACT|nr:TcpD family membrane protein [Lactococcus protaetiae]QDK70761.1 hypothetical protein FLP15_05815 [Lactococcus protaetiae]